MKAIVRLKLEMAARARDYLRNHPLAGPGFTAAIIWFDALLARATEHSALQQEGIATERGATVKRAELRSLLRESLLRHLSGVALVAARERPEFGELFVLPAANLNHYSFVTAVGRMLAAAEENREFLTSKGLGEGVLDDIRKALTELEAVDATSRTARANHVGARADLDAVASEISDQVKLLDGAVRYRFRDDPELLAAWKSARNVATRTRKPVELPETPASQVPPAAAA
jgi:hypothetical protein